MASEVQAYYTVEVTAGSSEVWLPPYSSLNTTITAAPGSGGSALVESNNSDPDNLVEGAYVEWDAGTVTASTVESCTGVISALRMTATTADAVFYISQMTEHA